MVLASSSRVASGATNTVVALEYEADAQAGCIGEAELRRLVMTQLGRDPFRADADRRVVIVITKTEAGFEGRIVWADATGRSFGERRLDSRSPDCREIGANVAFAVAVQVQLIDLAASNGSAESVDLGSAPPETNPPAARKPRPAQPAEPAVPMQASEGAGPAGPPRRMTLAVGAGPALALGLSPQATALGRLFVVVHFGRVSAEIAADGTLPVTQGEPDGSGVVVGANGFSLAGCGRMSFLSGCLLGRRGWLRARGTGVDEPAGSSALFSQVGVRLAATRAFSRFDVRLYADSLVMLSRWNVVLNDTVVWSTPRIGVFLGVDLSLRFF